MFLRGVQKGDKEAYYNLGVLYFQQKNYDKAEEMFLKSIEETDDVNAYFNLGLLYSQEKKYDKAEEMFLKAAQYGEKKAYYDLGILYFQQKI
ncbi:tetratricopeptide repeat protein [Leptotrichia alba]|uniref:Tetratricopeptide repeat protein n=1 Tax=Leptotrichia alba TaxID=3239304 RepID=A0AB39V6Z5_9FUSO